jgi:hypothetical protein
VARCSSEDTFDFETGAKIAFDRLVEDKSAKEAKPTKFEIGEQYEYKDNEDNGVIEITGKRNNWYCWKTIEGMNGWDFKEFQKNSDFARTLKRIEKSKYYNGKVVCVESSCSRLLTKGKIYSIIDGEFTFDEGGKVYEIKSFEDLSDRFESKFVELVE